MALAIINAVVKTFLLASWNHVNYSRW